MTCKRYRLVCLVSFCLTCAIGSLPHSASALDTPNVLMGIDGMVLTAGGLFRDPASFPYHNLPLNNVGAPIPDGFNTFQFGGFSINPPITTGYGQYDAFRWQKTAVGDCCISHNARHHSDSPDNVSNVTATPQVVQRVGEFDPAIPTADFLSVTKDHLPIVDRAFFGQLFDPSQYQLQVKFKPLLQKTTADSLGTNPYPTNPVYPNITAPLENTAPFITVGIDQLGGMVWDAQAGVYKRGNEQVFYDIGSAATPINTWYASAPHDADGFATFSVPVTTPTNIARGFYYGFGNGGTRTYDVATNGGIDAAGTDVITGYGANFQNFGGGPADPSNPSAKLNTPNGAPLIFFGAPNAQTGVSLEIKSIALTKITPGPIVARIDANSGITFRFGTGFTYQGGSTITQPAINVNGVDYRPTATDQISRFNENGMTNLTFNMRTPDAANEVHRFLIRGAPSPLAQDATATPGSGIKFLDCSNCTVNIRAKLTQALSTPGVAQSLMIVAKDRDGSDNGAGKGADQWEYNLALNQFNTSTMTTVSVPLSMFTRNMTATTLGPPIGFDNFGDGSLSNFGLYEFGGLIPANGGLLKLEMEYMEIRLPAATLAGDYNNNGIVDAADYALWRNDPASFGGNPGGYDTWRANFGKTAGGGAALGAAVPEPASCLLSIIGLMGLASWRRKSDDR